MKSQLSKQIARVRELRVKKVEQPGTVSFLLGKRELTVELDMCVTVSDAFYGDDDVDLHNIDVMTDISMAPTAFTRYTAAPSTASKKSRWDCIEGFPILSGRDANPRLFLFFFL